MARAHAAHRVPPENKHNIRRRRRWLGQAIGDHIEWFRFAESLIGRALKQFSPIVVLQRVSPDGSGSPCSVA
jgi:hypothetical protein